MTSLSRPSSRRKGRGSSIVLSSQKLLRYQEARDDDESNCFHGISFQSKLVAVARIKRLWRIFAKRSKLLVWFKGALIPRWRARKASIAIIQHWWRRHIHDIRISRFRQHGKWQVEQANKVFACLILGRRARLLMRSDIIKTILSSQKDGCRVMNEILQSIGKSCEIVEEIFEEMAALSSSEIRRKYPSLSTADVALTKSLVKQRQLNKQLFHDCIFHDCCWRDDKVRPTHWDLSAAVAHAQHSNHLKHLHSTNYHKTDELTLNGTNITQAPHTYLARTPPRLPVAKKSSSTSNKWLASGDTLAGPSISDSPYAHHHNGSPAASQSQGPHKGTSSGGGGGRGDGSDSKRPLPVSLHDLLLKNDLTSDEDQRRLCHSRSSDRTVTSSLHEDLRRPKLSHTLYESAISAMAEEFDKESDSEICIVPAAAGVENASSNRHPSARSRSAQSTRRPSQASPQTTPQSSISTPQTTALRCAAESTPQANNRANTSNSNSALRSSALSSHASPPPVIRSATAVSSSSSAASAPVLSLSKRVGNKPHLQVDLISATQLMPTRKGAQGDDRRPCLRLTLLLPAESDIAGAGGASLKKTQKLEKEFENHTLNPVWDATFHFNLPISKRLVACAVQRAARDVPLEDNISELSCELVKWWALGQVKVEVWDGERFNDSIFMGEVTLLLSSLLVPYHNLVKSTVRNNSRQLGEVPVETLGNFALSKINSGDRVSGSLSMHVYMHLPLHSWLSNVIERACAVSVTTAVSASLSSSYLNQTDCGDMDDSIADILQRESTTKKTQLKQSSLASQSQPFPSLVQSSQHSQHTPSPSLAASTRRMKMQDVSKCLDGLTTTLISSDIMRLASPDTLMKRQQHLIATSVSSPQIASTDNCHAMQSTTMSATSDKCSSIDPLNTTCVIKNHVKLIKLSKGSSAAAAAVMPRPVGRWVPLPLAAHVPGHSKHENTERTENKSDDKNGNASASRRFKQSEDSDEVLLDVSDDDDDDSAVAPTQLQLQASGHGAGEEQCVDVSACLEAEAEKEEAEESQISCALSSVLCEDSQVNAGETTTETEAEAEAEGDVAADDSVHSENCTAIQTPKNKKEEQLDLSRSQHNNNSCDMCLSTRVTSDQTQKKIRRPRRARPPPPPLQAQPLPLSLPLSHVAIDLQSLDL